MPCTIIMLTHLHELSLPSDVATCHAWNSDNSLLACCHGTPIVAIYSIKLGTSNPVEQLVSLREHNQVVSSMQWSNSNLLVTCSHDRTSYVWVKDGESWTQQMVITRLQRAALCVQWAPNGKKFAIGSGTNNCCVCSYEEENKWWAGKVIRKAHSSSVVCLAWHPDNMKLATGSTDGYCKVFYADKPGGNPTESHQFGTLLASINLQCWVNSISWDPSGMFIAAAGHDAHVHIWDFQNSEESTLQIPLPGLPATCVAHLDSKHIVCGGWDGVLHVLQKQSSDWVVRSVVGKTLQEPTEGGFSARLLSMLPWNQAKGQGAGGGEALQHGACIQQISILQHAQHGSTQPAVTFSVLDRYSMLKVWQWSLEDSNADPVGS